MDRFSAPSPHQHQPQDVRPGWGTRPTRWPFYFSAVTWGIATGAGLSVWLWDTRTVGMMTLSVTTTLAIVGVALSTSGRSALYGQDPGAMRVARDQGEDVLGVLEDVSSAKGTGEDRLRLSHLTLLVADPAGMYRTRSMGNVDPVRPVARGEWIPLRRHPEQPGLVVPVEDEQSGLRTQTPPAWAVELMERTNPAGVPEFDGRPTTAAGVQLTEAGRVGMGSAFFVSGALAGLAFVTLVA